MYAPAYFDGIELRQNGLKMMVIVASIGLEVRFEPPSPRYYRVVVSPALFWNQTEGLCGLCNGNFTDDFLSRDGKVIEDEFEFGYDWLEPPGGDREGCIPPAEPTACIPSQEVIDWCSKINSTIFETCHGYVDTREYYETCIRDGCANSTAGNCWAFESYTEECSGNNICIPWRSDEFCPEPCPDGLVYRQCNCPIAEIDSCSAWEHFECPLDPIAGCFCPEGTVPDGNHPTNITCIPCESTPPTIFPITTPTKAPGSCEFVELDPVEVQIGLCIGYTPATACMGKCASSYRITGYDNLIPITEQSCANCAPTEYETVMVDLVCPGNVFKQVEVQTIRTCECLAGNGAECE
ncbi:von Willebrand factor-like [Anneissia japonica]|uniref:von Willebrand factor-like n=1 Tax=Anneissia japonica TaxID=1529436 RepID=UPI0014259B30|nr:von Willebrand factor-like [Anneissia japonica]